MIDDSQFPLDEMIQTINKAVLNKDHAWREEYERNVKHHSQLVRPVVNKLAISQKVSPDDAYGLCQYAGGDIDDLLPVLRRLTYEIEYACPGASVFRQYSWPTTHGVVTTG